MQKLYYGGEHGKDAPEYVGEYVKRMKEALR